jgi:hypothetical protein
MISKRSLHKEKKELIRKMRQREFKRNKKDKISKPWHQEDMLLQEDNTDMSSREVMVKKEKKASSISRKPRENSKNTFV